MHPTPLYPTGIRAVGRYKTQTTSLSHTNEELQDCFTVNPLDPEGVQKKNDASNEAGLQAQVSQVGLSTAPPPCHVRGLCC